MEGLGEELLLGWDQWETGQASGVGGREAWSGV